MGFLFLALLLMSVSATSADEGGLCSFLLISLLPYPNKPRFSSFSLYSHYCLSLLSMLLVVFLTRFQRVCVCFP